MEACEVADKPGVGTYNDPCRDPRQTSEDATFRRPQLCTYFHRSQIDCY